MLFFSFILALVIGTYVGKLIVQDFFNNKISPFDPVNEVSELEIVREFEKQADWFISNNMQYWRSCFISIH